MVQPASPWWVEKIAVPGFFVVLGAILGWVIGEFRERRQAHRAKRAFLRAIGLELDAIRAQLEATSTTVVDSLGRLERGGSPPLLAGVLRRTVFNTQLGKLRDVDDAKIMEVILLYSDLGTIEQVLTQVNEQSTELAKLKADVTVSSVYTEPSRSRMKSALLVLNEECGRYVNRIAKLREKLPGRAGPAAT